LALEAVADRISLEGLFPPAGGIEESRGEGAGAGYGQTGRGAGTRRAYHVFNPLPYDREEVVPITVWDYEGDINQAAAEAPAADGKAGTPLALQHGESGGYWGHHFDTLLVKVAVPSCGYATVIIEEKAAGSPAVTFINDMRTQHSDRFSLENDYIRAELNPLDGSIASFTDKKTGAELAPRAGGFGVFRLASEGHHKNVTEGNPGMSAWFTGRFKKIEDINQDIEIRPAASGDMRTAFELTAPFGSGSRLKAVISLEAGSRLLRYDVTCDWREFGAADTGIPNLHFRLALNYPGNYLFDVPFGLTRRAAADMDLPAESFVLAENRGGKASVALFSLDKYAFRCLDDSLALTLIRGAIDPDPPPETGRHLISFALGPVAAGASGAGLVKESLCYRRALTVISATSLSTLPGAGGGLAPSGSFCAVKGGILSSVKQPEQDACGSGGDGPAKRLIFRIYEVEGKEAAAQISLVCAAAASAWFTDAAEEKHLGDCAVSSDGKTVSFTLPPHSVRAVLVTLKTDNR
jgi:alpha-mannosidase